MSRAAIEVRRYRQPRPFRRRLVLIGGAGAVAAVFLAASHGMAGKSRSFPLPSKASLATMSTRERIVAIATSQVGYTTDPADSHCNKFSGFWAAGDACSNGDASEEWCADFAAWAWREAGVQFTYGFGPGKINGGAVSFYEWAVANGRWQPATAAYEAAPGDVAVYGLSLGAAPHAAHVAVVVRRGPDVVNGNGDLTAFSAVETGSNERYITAGHKRYVLAGYARPPD